MEDQEVDVEGEEEMESEEDMDESAFIYDPNEVDSGEDDELELNVTSDNQAPLGDMEDMFLAPKSKATKGKKKVPKTFGERTTKKVKPNVEVEVEYEYDNERDLQNA